MPVDPVPLFAEDNVASNSSRPLLRGAEDPIESVLLGSIIPKADPEPQTAKSKAPIDTTTANGSKVVTQVQTGLERLGFMTNPVSGVFDDNTAMAIREFEIYNNYSPTGRITAELIELLTEAGAFN